MGIKGSYIVFHPETPAHGVQRQWPKENYIELAKKIIGAGKNKVLVAGTAGEKDSILQIVSSIGPGAFAVTGISLGEYAAVLAKAKMLVCGNTGIMHLGSALDIPLIALHGPTNPLKWGPLGSKSIVIKSRLSCSPCLYLGFEYGCATNRCMRDISVEEVFKKVQEFAN